MDLLPPVSSNSPGQPVAAGSACEPDPLLSFVLHAVFILSGLAALLYQMIWQRALLILYGSNTESVAMIVSAFLVGLGVGALAGGAVSERPGAPLVLMFSAAELLIGAYGLISLRLFHWVGEFTLHAGTLETGVLAFTLVFVPTSLMGATLPLLVAFRVQTIGHVGRSVSWLYFVNTLGAGAGAFLAPLVFLRHFGMSGSIQAAALLNLTAASSILVLWQLRRRRP